MEDYIDTDLILKQIRQFGTDRNKEPKLIRLHPMDIRYLKSNPGYMVGDGNEIFGLKIVEDDRIQIGHCIVSSGGIKKW